ncbi:MAG: hypothetical protein HPY69_08730 [Armatimonadetes bacterium]|nr:hypothetical protein [Armatimonadota bacterium]
MVYWRSLFPALCLSVLVAALVASDSSADQTTASLDARFGGYDLNDDGTIELRWVRSLGMDRRPSGPSRGLVLVIVEPRLLGMTGPDVAPSTALRGCLYTFSRDLACEGWRVRVVAMQVYDGPRHQDGRTLLAIRRYLLAVRRQAPDLAGVVFVGSFPEGAIVRTYNWRQLQPTVLHDGQPEREDFGGRPVPRVVTMGELVAHRSDLMLADLDGNWERIYHEGPEKVPTLWAVYPNKTPPPDKSPESEWALEGPTWHYDLGSTTHQDFFWVNDGQYELQPWGRHGVRVKLLDERRDGECSPADRKRANPMSVPQILVSRIDARHIALRPKQDVRGVNGEGLLDASGRPQIVTFASEAETPNPVGIWERDPDLEQRLLVEYFDRNHRYRHGAFAEHLSPASAEYGLGSFMDELRTARAEWQDFALPGCDVTGETADLTAVVNWLRRPAVLRGIAAHSDPWGANFKAVEPANVPALEAACGGQPWSWRREGNRLVPGLYPTGKLDFAILRTLWQNGVLPDSANLFLHSGCEITAPEGAASLPYSDPKYGYWQGAETLLFYAKGLALVGRSKVFYDFPTGFAAELGAGKTFGEAWRRYFEVESAATDIEQVGGGIGRKRAYFWNVIGDWTLRLVPAAEGPGK